MRKSQEQGYKGPPTEVVAANSHQCRHRVWNIRNKTKIRWVVITLVLATKLLSLYFKVLKDQGKKYTVETKQAVTVVCVYGTKIVVLKYV